WHSTIRTTAPSTSMWVPFLNWLVEITDGKASRRLQLAAVRSRKRQDRRSTRERIMRGTRCAALALAFSVLGVGLLAPSAIAKKTLYEGPLLGPPAQNGASSISFRLVSKPKCRQLI